MTEVRITPVIDAAVLSKQIGALAALNVATVHVLEQEGARMPQDSPVEVAKAALRHAAMAKILDGKTPEERARILAGRRSPTKVAKGSEPLDGKTPSERAEILAARGKG